MGKTINRILPYEKEIKCNGATIAIINQVHPIKVSSFSYEEKDKYDNKKKVYVTEATFDLNLSPKTRRSIRVSYELKFYDSQKDKIYTYKDFNNLFFITNQNNIQSLAKIETESEVDIYDFEYASFKIIYAVFI